jgi:hypothetical protein
MNHSFSEQETSVAVDLVQARPDFRHCAHPDCAGGVLLEDVEESSHFHCPK